MDVEVAVADRCAGGVDAKGKYKHLVLLEEESGKDIE
jgi:hypothetical protein